MSFPSLLLSWLLGLPSPARLAGWRRARRYQPPALRRPALEHLEDRIVPSGLPPKLVISGPSSVGEGMPYTLRMIAADPENDPVSQWTINWGDGAITTLSGNPSRASHTYAGGPVVRNISATAVVGGESFAANKSGAGAYLGVFGDVSDTREIAFGPDITGDGVRELYVSTIYSLSVYDITNGSFVRDLAAPGSAAGLTEGPDGALYFCDRPNGRILRYDFTTDSVSTFVNSGSGGLDDPNALAFGPDTNGNGTPELYVSSRLSHQILHYDGYNGAPLGVLVANTTGPHADTLVEGGIAFGPDGKLYITNYWGGSSWDQGGSVLRYDFSTHSVSAFVRSGSGRLDTAERLAFGPDGDLYVGYSSTVSRSGNTSVSSVNHYDGLTGAYLGTLTDNRGWSIGGLAFGPDNTLYENAGPAVGLGRFSGPLTTTADTQLPVTVLKVTTKTYSYTKATAIPDLKTIAPTITVSDSARILDVNVKLSITHPNDADLSASLLNPAGFNPAGRTVHLFISVGGTGDNFQNTTLDDEATSPIAAGTAPFAGSYQSEDALDQLDDGPSQGTWTMQVADTLKGNKGTLNSWSITFTFGTGPAALMAATAGPGTDAVAPSDSQIQPLLAEAQARWQATGTDTSALANIQVQVANLGGTTLGLASGHTIWIDDNAAGWGWFVDPTPHDDSEFTTRGNQGEQNRMDLLTVLMHEMGHTLGLDHDADGVMQESLPTGTRRLPSADESTSLSVRPAIPAAAPSQAPPLSGSYLAADVDLVFALLSDPTTRASLTQHAFR